MSSDSGIKEIAFIGKYRWIFVAQIIITTITVIPIGLWQAIKPDEYSWIFLNSSIGLFLLILVPTSLYFGIKLMRIVRNLYKSTRSSDVKIYLQKVKNFLGIFKKSKKIEIIFYNNISINLFFIFY